MTSQIHKQNQSAKKETHNLPSTEVRGMFQPRPFVVQSKENNLQQPNFKTSLMQTDNYGYRLQNIQTPGALNTTALQQKKARESNNSEAIQMAPVRGRSSRGTTRPHPYSRPAHPAPRMTYSPGQHGYKRNEQQRLSVLYGFPVSGRTHQSEHTIGFEPLNQTSGLRRGTPGRTSQLENRAPAYQEMYQPHRDHIGTGMHSNADASGFNSQSYRDTQRQLIESGDVSSAVQINQLGYAFNPNFQSTARTPHGLAATNSYNTMVNNMRQVEYAQGANNVPVPVNRLQQQEMLLARQAAITGQWPTSFQINRARMESQSDILLRGQQQRQQGLSAMNLS